MIETQKITPKQFVEGAKCDGHRDKPDCRSYVDVKLCSYCYDARMKRAEEKGYDQGYDDAVHVLKRQGYKINK